MTRPTPKARTWTMWAVMHANMPKPDIYRMKYDAEDEAKGWRMHGAPDVRVFAVTITELPPTRTPRTRRTT